MACLRSSFRSFGSNSSLPSVEPPDYLSLLESSLAAEGCVQSCSSLFLGRVKGIPQYCSKGQYRFEADYLAATHGEISQVANRCGELHSLPLQVERSAESAVD